MIISESIDILQDSRKKWVVSAVNRRRRYKRGYPVAILLGLEEDYAILWQIYSRVIKHLTKIKFEGRRFDEKSLYNFHQLIIEKIKPILDAGVKTVIVSAPSKTDYSSKFIDHLQKHHRYLFQSKSSIKLNFAEIEGSAKNKSSVTELVKSNQFFNLLEETTSEEADDIVDVLEKHLCSEDTETVVLYSLKEIENIVYRQDIKNEKLKTPYLILTDNYLSKSRNKNRVHRLMQIAKNGKVRVRIISEKNQAGNRVNQFGGIIFFAKKNI